MSADAKVWLDEDGWHGIHDGTCHHAETHAGTSFDLVEVLQTIEGCFSEDFNVIVGTPGIHRVMRWELRTYADGSMGLVGFTC